MRVGLTPQPAKREARKRRTDERLRAARAKSSAARRYTFCAGRRWIGTIFDYEPDLERAPRIHSDDPGPPRFLGRARKGEIFHNAWIGRRVTLRNRSPRQRVKAGGALRDALVAPVEAGDDPLVAAALDLDADGGPHAAFDVLAPSEAATWPLLLRNVVRVQVLLRHLDQLGAALVLTRHASIVTPGAPLPVWRRGEGTGSVFAGGGGSGAGGGFAGERLDFGELLLLE